MGGDNLGTLLVILRFLGGGGGVEQHTYILEEFAAYSQLVEMDCYKN